MVWRKNGEQLVVLYGCAAAAVFLAAGDTAAAAVFLAAGDTAAAVFLAAGDTAAAVAFLGGVTERNSEAASEQLLDLLRHAHQGLSTLKFYL